MTEAPAAAAGRARGSGGCRAGLGVLNALLRYAYVSKETYTYGKRDLLLH